MNEQFFKKSGNQKNVLILGGTTESYLLAEKLSSFHFRVLTSLAGRTQNPRQPNGDLRIGGFGGIDGLINYLYQENIYLIIDATHPFADQITTHASIAAKKTGVHFLRLERKPWQQQTEDHWIQVKTIQQASKILPSGARVFLAIGRQYLKYFFSRIDIYFIARMMEPPTSLPSLPIINIFLEKPQILEKERQFLSYNKIDFLVCKNSGGEISYAKLIAARELSLPVVIVNRKPIITNNCNLVHTVDEALDQIFRYLYVSDYI